MRFNHMELTFARGTLTDGFREEVDAFYVKYLLPIYFDVQCLERTTAPTG